MIGLEYINILKEYTEYFDFDKEAFDELLNTDINIMGLMDERVYKITPLLIQIASYAYGESILNDLDAEYYNMTGMVFDAPICPVIRNCFNYIDELASNECHHPTVLMFKDLMCGSKLYEDMTDNMSYSTEYVDSYLKDKIIDFLSNVDEKLIDYKDSFYGKIYKLLDNVRNWNDLIRIFGIYGRLDKESKLLVLNEFKASCVDESWIKFYNKGNKNPDAYYTEEFYKVMGHIEDKIDTIDKYSDEDEDLFDTLYEIKDNFEEYRAYHYEYIKSSYKEEEIFKKCLNM